MLKWPCGGMVDALDSKSSIFGCEGSSPSEATKILTNSSFLGPLMSTIDGLMKNRRTIHHYSSELIPDKDILEAIESALFAPSHKLTFPTRFTIVPSSKRKEMADISLKIRKQKGRVLTEEDTEKIFQKFQTPSHLLIVSQIKNEDPTRSKEDYATVSMAIQNFSLSLWEKGYGTKWSSGIMIHAPELYTLTRINPELESIEAMLWAGKPTQEPPPPKRPSVKDILRTLV